MWGIVPITLAVMTFRQRRAAGEDGVTDDGAMWRRIVRSEPPGVGASPREHGFEAVLDGHSSEFFLLKGVGAV